MTTKTRTTRSRKTKKTEAAAPEAPAAESPAPAADVPVSAPVAAIESVTEQAAKPPLQDDLQVATVQEFGVDESAPPSDIKENPDLKPGETVLEGTEESHDEENGKVIVPSTVIIPPSEMPKGRELIDPKTLFVRNNCATFGLGQGIRLGIRAFYDAGRGTSPVLVVGDAEDPEKPETRGARLGYIRSVFDHPPEAKEVGEELVIRSAKVVWRKMGKPPKTMFRPLLGGPELRARPYTVAKFSTLAEAGVDDLFRGKIEKTTGTPKTLCYGQTGRGFRWQQARIMAMLPGEEVTLTDSLGVAYVLTIDENWRLCEKGEPVINLPFLREQLENAKGLIEASWKEIATAKGDDRRKLIGRMMAGGYLSVNAALIASGGPGNPNWWPEVLQVLGTLAKQNLLAGQLGDYVDDRCPDVASLREFHRIRDAVGHNTLDLRSITREQARPRKGKRH